jgi:hypothetical protein
MHDDEKEARSFNEEQQKMFGDSEAYQAGTPVRPRTPGTDTLPPPDFAAQPADEARDTEANEAEPLREIVAVRGEGGTDITGGTDKYGPGGLADPDHTHSTGATETGDLTGATSTHAGAGGNQGPKGGTGTAPTEQ